MEMLFIGLIILCVVALVLCGVGGLIHAIDHHMLNSIYGAPRGHQPWRSPRGPR